MTSYNVNPIMECKNCISYAVCRGKIIDYLIKNIQLSIMNDKLDVLYNHSSEIYRNAYYYKILPKCEELYVCYRFYDIGPVECKDIVIKMFNLPNIHILVGKNYEL